jgi:serine/threonine-protein kinase HipA
MVFNYAVDNKDDHCKNFSFILLEDASGKTVWRLAPAYDLTLCTEGYNGEHATSVNGSSRPTEADMIAAGAKGKLRPERCRRLITEVQEVCREMMK